MRNILKNIALVLFLIIPAIAIIACSSEDNKSNNTLDTGTLVKPRYNRTKVLRNPLNGWVMYAAKNADESYWDNEFWVSDLGENVQVKDYASACYIRTSWSSLNPTEDEYVWRDPNSRLGNLINGAAKRGLPIAFRIVVDGRDQGMNTPKWVFDAGAKSYLQDPRFPDRITPIPQDPIFQKYYEKFIKALAEDFNDSDRTAFIDAYGLGKWGEAHNVIYEDVGEKVTENTERLKEEVFEWITDLYTKHFTKVPLVINYHRVLGHPASWGSANENSASLLAKAISKGYSLRQDAFGMTDYYQSWEKNFAKTWNFKRPIIMEGGWITGGTHRYWIDPSGKYREGHPEDVRQGEFEASKDSRVNMMDFRAGYETETWFTTSFSLVQQFVSEGGYRLFPEELYLPETIKNNQEFGINHKWRNMGWGYFPNNIPQWNYKYKVAFALLDKNNHPVKILIDKNAEPSEWINDKPASYTYKATLSVAPGEYTWATAIVDIEKNNSPAIELPVNNNKTKDGWIELIKVKVE